MNSFLILLGAQFGKEGKTKLIENLINEYDFHVKYFNHDLLENNNLNIIPNTIFKANKQVVISQLVYIDLERLVDEINFLKSINLKLNNLFISDECILIFDFHKELEDLFFGLDKNFISKNHLTGFKQAYWDKKNNFVIKLKDLENFDIFYKKLSNVLVWKNNLFQKLNEKLFNPYTVAYKYFDLYKKLKPYIFNTKNIIRKAIFERKKIIFDPCLSLISSNNFNKIEFINILKNLPIELNASTRMFNNVLAVLRPYIYKQNDNQVFFTKVDDEVNKLIVNNQKDLLKNNSSNIGWLDLSILKNIFKIYQINKIAISFVDCLNEISKIKVCVGYLKNNKIFSLLNVSEKDTKDISPIYQTFDGWNFNKNKIKNFKDFPLNLKKYLLFIEKFLEVQIKYISFGNNPDEIIKIEPY